MSEPLQNCPPKEAEDAAGEYYRCVKRDPPIGEDFETAEGQHRYPDADPCMRKAVSLFRDLKSAEHQLVGPPWLLMSAPSSISVVSDEVNL